MNGEIRDILHVVERCRGGVATYVSRAIERQRGQDPARAVSLVADPALLDPGLAKLAGEVIPYAAGRRPDRAVRAARAVQAAIDARKPDIVHLHSSFPGVYGRLFANRGPDGPAIVYCAHGWAFEMEAPAWKKAAYRRLERWLAPRADVIVSISDYERMAALVAGIDGPGAIAIPHGAPPPKAGPAPAAMRQGGLNLLFVGRFDRQKGLDLLLEAFRRVRRQDIRLHVVGAADQTAETPDFSDPRVQAHGWVPVEDLDSWYAAADALVMPSRWEGFGLVAIEAMRNGTAVLASDNGALPEVLDHGDAGWLFDPEDAEGLAALIEGLDAGRLAALGKAGEARWRAAYGQERADAALDAAYDLALARRRARR